MRLPWRHIRLAFVAAVCGAVVFWGPDIAHHAWRGYDAVAERGLLSLACALLVIASCMGLAYGWRRSLSCGWVAGGMLVGIWASGLFCMMVAFSFSGGGFSKPFTLRELIFPILLLPITTVAMAAYDGTLLALVIVTGVLGYWWVHSLQRACQRCGAKVRFRERFCGWCGASVIAPPCWGWLPKHDGG